MPALTAGRAIQTQTHTTLRGEDDKDDKKDKKDKNECGAARSVDATPMVMKGDGILWWEGLEEGSGICTVISSSAAKNIEFCKN